MRQFVSGQFPGGPYQYSSGSAASSIQSCQDTPLLVGNSPQLSSGATAQIPAVLNGPNQNDKWQLQSVSVSAYLGLTNAGALGEPKWQPYGKLGKIFVALDPTSGQGASGFIGGSSGQPWSVQMAYLPTDSTLITDLWNPANDPLPPAAPFFFGESGVSQPTPTPNSLLPITATIIPPNPIDLIPGVQPYIGIWMTPSLIGDASGVGGYGGLTVFYAKYIINYDDGL